MIELLGLGNAGALGVNGEEGRPGKGERWEGNPEGMQTKVAKADFCGCVIKGEVVEQLRLGWEEIGRSSDRADDSMGIQSVTDAKNRDLVDVEGIIVHETEQTFKIVTRASKVKGAFIFQLSALPAAACLDFSLLRVSKLTSSSSRLFAPVIPKQSTTFTFSIPIPTLTLNTSKPTTQPNASASSSRSSTPLPTVQASPPPPPSTSTKKIKQKRLEFDLYGSQFLFRNSDRAGRKFKSHAGIEIEGALG